MAIARAVEVAAVCGIAAVTALAIAVVPLVWHPRDRDKLETLMAFAEQWPPKPIEAPVEPPPNVVTFEPPLPVPPENGFRHPVQTVKFVPVTVAPKTGLKVEREEPDEPKVEPRRERRDVCFPGHRVERNHGRSWRCVYAGGRHRHHGG